MTKSLSELFAHVPADHIITSCESCSMGFHQLVGLPGPYLCAGCRARISAAEAEDVNAYLDAAKAHPPVVARPAGRTGELDALVGYRPPVDSGKPLDMYNDWVPDTDPVNAWRRDS